MEEQPRAQPPAEGPPPEAATCPISGAPAFWHFGAVRRLFFGEREDRPSGVPQASLRRRRRPSPPSGCDIPEPCGDARSTRPAPAARPPMSPPGSRYPWESNPGSIHSCARSGPVPRMHTDAQRRTGPPERSQSSHDRHTPCLILTRGPP